MNLLRYIQEHNRIDEKDEQLGKFDSDQEYQHA